MAPASVALRPAIENDIPAINAIHGYYVQNTVITFTMVPLTDEEALSKFRSIISQSLPYIVAIDDSTNKVLGYTYVTGFRSGKGGYRHTVEMSLFCHPDHRNHGVGTILLKKLIEVLKEPESYPEFITDARPEDSRVRSIMACMSVDVTSRNNGLGLKEYYEKFGFEQVGHLKRVGHKHDQWIDTIYLQLSLW
ncbi:acyl-CoA N-acyltransferase [Lepidopterella palustris CBS 459.81]|uniref:Acyl-CoA N-acyltransferase n=1 Tax=Lepidopterella palustris CBS 459.81 TaxID=1314670 RepID=A0A8E2J9N8_9PEZI|nr:acyl-CoA N-acyltransferase [Lepidopterella palustris CBS 459.81]